MPAGSGSSRAHDLTIPRAIAQSKKLFLLVVGATTLLCGLIGARQAASYTAIASIIVEPQQGSLVNQRSVPAIDAKRYAADQASILRLRVTAERASDLLGQPRSPGGDASDVGTPAAPNLSVRDIQDGLVVQTNPDASVIEVRFRHDDAGVATAGANAVIQAYEQVRVGRARDSAAGATEKLQTALGTLDAQLIDLDARIAAMAASFPASQQLSQQTEILLQLSTSADAVSQTNAALVRIQALEIIKRNELAAPEYTSLLDQRSEVARRRSTLQGQIDQMSTAANETAVAPLVSPAVQPKDPQGFGIVQFGLAGMLLGLFPAALLCYLVVSMRPRIGSSNDAQRAIGAPLLAEIPDFGHEGVTSLPVRSAPMTAAAESFLFLAASLPTQGKRTPVLAVTSADVGDGKTVTAANLGLALSATLDVIAIDGDVDQRGLSRIFAVHPAHPDLLDLLDGDIDFEDALLAIDLDGQSELRVLSLRPSDARLRARDALTSVDVEEVLEEARKECELVIVDLPAALTTAYTSSVIRRVDGVIVVVRNQTRSDRLEQLRERLTLLGVPIVGFVFNRAPLRPLRTPMTIDLRQTPTATNGQILVDTGAE